MYEELIAALNAADKHPCSDLECPGSGECPTVGCLFREAADAIEELNRRETPMRVRITTSTKRCPSCNKQVSGIGNIHGNYRYCRWCGQAIDWSEPPKEEADV